MTTGHEGADQTHRSRPSGRRFLPERTPEGDRRVAPVPSEHTSSLALSQDENELVPPPPAGGAVSGPGREPRAGPGHDDFRAVLDTLYRTHRQLLVRFALTFLDSPADAEDVVHEVFRDVLKRGPDAPSVDLSYLRRSVRNRALNHGRDGISRRQGRDSWARDRRISGRIPSDPERVFEARQTVGVLRAAVARLPDGEREAWECVYVRGASRSEAADALGISANALTKRLWRARTRIREHLRSRGFECLDDVIGGAA